MRADSFNLAAAVRREFDAQQQLNREQRRLLVGVLEQLGNTVRAFIEVLPEEIGPFPVQEISEFLVERAILQLTKIFRRKFAGVVPLEPRDISDIFPAFNVADFSSFIESLNKRLFETALGQFRIRYPRQQNIPRSIYIEEKDEDRSSEDDPRWGSPIEFFHLTTLGELRTADPITNASIQMILPPTIFADGERKIEDVLTAVTFAITATIHPRRPVMAGGRREVTAHFTGQVLHSFDNGAENPQMTLEYRAHEYPRSLRNEEAIRRSRATWLKHRRGALRNPFGAF